MISIDRARIRDHLRAIMQNGAMRLASLFADLRESRFVRRFSWWKAFTFVFLCLSVVAIGLLVGAMSVVLPPMFALGTVVVPLLVLIWIAPELKNIPLESLQKSFFIVLFVEICIPIYYAIQIPGLPWISARRLVLVTLIVLFCISVSGSKALRAYIHETLSCNKLLYVCFTLYFIMICVSILTSRSPAETISVIAEFTINGYVPALACIIAVRSGDDLRKVLWWIGVFSMIVAGFGIADFVMHKNVVASFLPSGLASALMQANPSLVGVFENNALRNGQYRACSVFNTALSLGEFAAMVAPIGGYFLVHGEKWREQLFGALVLFAAIASLFVSGARGGNVAFLATLPVFLVLWIARNSRNNPLSMAGALGGGIAFLAVSALFGLIFSWGALRNQILGGSETASSDASRFEQASMAWKHIVWNPLTGYGLGNAAATVGWVSPAGVGSLDSGILTLIVESGFLGFGAFFGMLLIMAWTTGRAYLFGSDRDSALGIAFCCSAIVYSIYRMVLSQRENQSLLFILIGCVFVFSKVMAERARKAAKEEDLASSAGRPAVLAEFIPGGSQSRV